MYAIRSYYAYEFGKKEKIKPAAEDKSSFTVNAIAASAVAFAMHFDGDYIAERLESYKTDDTNSYA